MKWLQKASPEVFAKRATEFISEFNKYEVKKKGK
jgi:hypothetical protein